VLRWMAANLVVEQDAAGNLKPSKAKSTERIDGMVAAIMALARLTAPHEPAPGEPAIIGLWRSMAAEAEARRAAQLPGPGEPPCSLHFRTPVSSIGVCGLRAGHSGEHEEV
jgi:Terminase large subunit, endonuclease domain